MVLELLAAICLVKGKSFFVNFSHVYSNSLIDYFSNFHPKGGHEIILESFDRFKDICGEKRRFQTLMGYFMNYEMFHIEFMVACTQVHSTFRVQNTAVL